MKVLKRVLIKTVILLLIVALSGGGAACWQAYRQSTPEYAMKKYLSLLIDSSSEKAYALLDQSEDGEITKEEYQTTLEAKKYSLYSDYNLFEMEKRRDNDGQEYIDYQIEFLDAASEVQASESFTVKKQSKATFGIFDNWKVLSGHCMVKNFVLTVPTGSEVYLNSEAADTTWIVRDGVKLSYDSYKIPSLLPGNISLVVRHPALESVNATLDAMSGSADYSDKMALKTSAKDEMKELAVKALKQVYTSAATEKTEDLEALFADCLEDVKKTVKEQTEQFHREDAEFKSVAVSKFDAKFGDLTFTEEDNGAITTEVTFSYHYDIREDVTTDTGEYYEDGSSIYETETKITSGDETARFVMAFYDGEWHIGAMELNVIP